MGTYKKQTGMKPLEKDHYDTYNGREGCLATIVILAAAMAAIIAGFIFAAMGIGIVNFIKAI